MQQHQYLKHSSPHFADIELQVVAPGDKGISVPPQKHQCQEHSSSEDHERVYQNLLEILPVIVEDFLKDEDQVDDIAYSHTTSYKGCTIYQKTLIFSDITASTTFHLY